MIREVPSNYRLKPAPLLRYGLMHPPLELCFYLMKLVPAPPSIDA
jgi:hypothetical protein